MRFAYSSPCCGMLVRCEQLPAAEVKAANAVSKVKAANAVSMHAGACPSCKSVVAIVVNAPPVIEVVR